MRAMIQSDKGTPAIQRRIHWIDNLRTLIIFFVVLYHIGGVYEAAGMWGWFWIVDDPATISWVGIVGIVFDICVMPTIFFVSGYLTPASFANKSAWGFVKRKFVRLMIPWAIAVVTLIPLYKVIFLYSRGLPQEHWSTYFHVTNPNSQNWLWFLPVLFCFNLVYLALDKSKVRVRISLVWAVVATTLFAIVSSYLIGDLAGFRSWTLTPLIDFENERLPLYLMTFLLGVYCFRNRTFEREPNKVLYNVANGLAWLPVTAHIFMRLLPFFVPQGFEVTPLYRLGWWASFHLAVLAMMYTLIESFRRYVDRTGPVWRYLNANSFGVYIIHVIVIGVFGTVLLNLNLPAVAKYILLSVTAYLGSNLAVSGWRALTRLVRSGRKDSTPVGY